MMDARAVFIDTNVLVYASVVESPFCLRARGLLKRLESGASELWVSRQVIREFLAQLTRAPQAEFAHRDLIAALSDFEHRYCVAEDHGLVTHQLVLLISQVPTGGKQIHDANIVATMLAYDIPQLVTFNVDDFRRFAGFVDVVNAMNAA